MKKLLLPILILLLVNLSFAQNPWQIQANVNQENVQIQARNASYFQLDLIAMKELLLNAPIKQIGQNLSPLLIELPLPNGSFESFMVFKDPIMHAELAAKFPQITTYVFQSIEHQDVYGRVDLTHKGFHALIFSETGTIYIDPFSQTDIEHYIVYYKKDFYTSKELPACMSTEEEIFEDASIQDNLGSAMSVGQAKAANGATLRDYDIAVSATAEYTAFHGGTVADGLAAIVTSVNRVNGVYERDFSISLTLVNNNDLIIYTNSGLDPFTDPNNPSAMLSQNQTSIDAIIGSANYDIGHVVGRSGSGLASFRSVCRSNKAQGTTGISNPIGDPFDIDYMAHEIGHQFGGSHTYNGSSGSCGGNISTNSAYEPGSGTTIMAYAGICAPQNIQNNSNDYFHVRSFDQITDYTVNSQGDNCPTKTTTGNAIPVVTVVSPNNLNIPFSTPFELEASATDANGDLLTYCWEQYDLGPSAAPNSPSGNAPLFRSFSPTTKKIRTFPQISDIVNNTQTMGEILPSYARSMKFRVSVRDNVVGHGAVDYQEMTVNVHAGAGPFLVTEPNANVSWTAGSTYLVEWDVANTDQAPVACSGVDIYLSTDGGYTYPILLESNVLNNGSAFVEAPFAITNSARVKVKGNNHIFFDISNQNFSITFDCSSVNSSISIDQNPSDGLWCLGATGVLEVIASSPELVITGYQWFFNGSPIAGATSNQLVVSNVQNNDAGVYYCIVSNDCNSVNSATANIQVTSSLIVPFITQIGNELISSLSSNNQWYLNDVAIPGATSSSLEITQQGVYYVASTVGQCSANSVVFVTSIKDLSSLTEIVIQPNPSKGIFNVALKDWKEETSYEVSDLLGKKIIQKDKQGTLFEVDLSTFLDGVYILSISSANTKTSVKLLKH